MGKVCESGPSVYPRLCHISVESEVENFGPCLGFSHLTIEKGKYDSYTVESAAWGTHFCLMRFYLSLLQIL